MLSSRDLEYILRTTLPNHFYGELNLPRRRLGRSDQSRIGDRIAAGVKDIPVIQGRREVRPIEYIEELRPELYVERIRNSFYVVVLEYGKIQVQKARPDEGVPPKVSTERNGIGYAETLGPNVVGWISCIDERSATGTARYVGNIDIGIGAFHAECIARETRGEGHTRAGFEDSAQLPPAQGP